MENARQIHGVVSATFPSFEETSLSSACEHPSNNVVELACSWGQLHTELKDFAKAKNASNDKLLIIISKVSLRIMLEETANWCSG